VHLQEHAAVDADHRLHGNRTLARHGEYRLAGTHSDLSVPDGLVVMALHIDHVFITCGVGAPEAGVLIERGFVEGSSNVHPGQGTANRRFFFANFTLELLWVANPLEATTDRVRHTGLWERWSRRGEGASRFGIVYSGVPADGCQLPFTTRSYYPAYLPPPMSIEVVQGLNLVEPALFWISHRAPVRDFRRIAIGLPFLRPLSEAARRVRDAELLAFFEAPSPVLEVHFEAEHDALIDCRPDLPLVFVGMASSPP